MAWIGFDLAECGRISMSMRALLVSTVKTAYHSAKRTWWVWIVLGLIEDRIHGMVDQYLDSQTGAFIAALRFMWGLLVSPPLGLVGTLAILVILALLVHAYVDTRTKASGGLEKAFFTRICTGHAVHAGRRKRSA